jgi:hypothetical protein
MNGRMDVLRRILKHIELCKTIIADFRQNGKEERERGKKPSIESFFASGELIFRHLLWKFKFIFYMFSFFDFQFISFIGGLLCFVWVYECKNTTTIK